MAGPDGPFTVSPGVLHTPRLPRQLLNRCRDRGETPETANREESQKQGLFTVSPKLNEARHPRQKVSHLLSHRPPEDLLTALLQLYWAEGVTQERAAKLLGIAKATFAELADLRLVTDGLERAARDYYREQFNYRFPECDPRCAPTRAKAEYVAPTMGASVMARSESCRAHDGTDADPHAKEPVSSECELLAPPQRRTLREVVPGTHKPDAEVTEYLRTHRVPLWKRFRDPEQLTGTENEPSPIQLGWND